MLRKKANKKINDKMSVVVLILQIAVLIMSLYEGIKLGAKSED